MLTPSNLKKLIREPAQTALGLVSRGSEEILNLRIKSAISRGYVPAVLPYTGYGTVNRVRVLGRVLLVNPRPSWWGKSTNVRGWRSFTSLPIADATVRVTIEGKSFDVQADDGGVVDAVLDANLEPGWHTVSMQVQMGEFGMSESAEAQVRIVNPEKQLGIISDIDDTVMVTALPRPMLAAWNTFVLDEHARMPTPGMAVLMERLTAAHQDAPVIYLSTGAWNVAPTLRRFLTRNLYPAGPLLLTDWGPTRERWFRSGKEHKRSNLRRIAEDFPHFTWILIGDDGQADETIYAEFAREFPDKVAAICIRELSVGEAVLAGGRSPHRLSRTTPGVPWAYAPDGAGLVAQLEQLGLLPETAKVPQSEERL